jgi:hypothetical protein
MIASLNHWKAWTLTGLALYGVSVACSLNPQPLPPDTAGGGAGGIGPGGGGGGAIVVSGGGGGAAGSGSGAGGGGGGNTASVFEGGFDAGAALDGSATDATFGAGDGEFSDAVNDATETGSVSDGGGSEAGDGSADTGNADVADATVQ